MTKYGYLRPHYYLDQLGAKTIWSKLLLLPKRKKILEEHKMSASHNGFQRMFDQTYDE